MPCYLMDKVELVVRRKLVEEDLQGVDILFFNRLISGISISQMEALKEKYGFKLIADFDDHWILGPDHYLYNQYQHFQASELMEEWIKISDCVFVTHERLFHDVFPLNQNVHILPNAIPEYSQFNVKKEESKDVRIFWAGGITHKRDIDMLKGPIRRIYRDGVKMVMGGFVKDNKEWLSMASAFTNGGKFNHELIEALPVDKYYHAYSKCDIALIPLHETKFNSYKSNLKILEAANIGAPVVVSRVHPYLGFPEDLVNYVGNQRDWHKQVKKLLDSPGQAIYQGERLKKYCDEHFNFTKINKHRLEIFEHETRKSKNLRNIPALSSEPGWVGQS